MPRAQGFVNDKKARVLRDNALSAVIVRQKFISEEQYTGEETKIPLG